MKQKQWLRARRRLRCLERGQQVCYQWKAKGHCSRGDQSSSGTTVMSVQKRHQKPVHTLSHQHQEVEVRREKRSLRGRRQSGKSNRQPCKNCLEGSCTELPCDQWHPSECQFHKTETGCNSAKSVGFRTGKLKNNQLKSRRRVVTKVQ